MGNTEKAPEASNGEWDGEKVSGLRYQMGLSQQEFARRLGVRQQTISEWETGLHAPRGASKRVLSMVAEEAARYVTASPPKRRGRRRKAQAEEA